jgi:hypothetical protein
MSVTYEQGSFIAISKKSFLTETFHGDINAPIMNPAPFTMTMTTTTTSRFIRGVLVLG